MKVFASECTFDYSWEEVSTANWQKYCPWNNKSTHVVAVDVLSRTLDPTSGILRTERLITCNQSAPQWILNLFGGSSTSHVYEVSYVDAAAKKVTMSSSNLTWSNVLNVKETVTYQPSKLRPTIKTDFKQDAQITALCGGWQKVKNKIEELSIETFSQNAKKGREGFETVLEMSRRVFREQREMELLRNTHQ
ncbi:Phospholipid metabolism protein [Ophidiomyces ophidiicola]|nr:Phospholipid metabolism protein [Ophidiomyces ophidiicola]KAI1941426.1 Phospholipid metabolism protein [Ophidiomyces ophidiicola]KAI1961193.1 Phospholipid metabolism protein [Ophidiomyces ophidiicola]